MSLSPRQDAIQGLRNASMDCGELRRFVSDRRAPVVAALATVLVFLLSAAPAPAAAPNQAKVLVGEVVVQDLPDRGIGVIVDSFAETSAEATAEYVFILQTDAPIPAELPLRFPGARVIFQEDRILVLSLNEPRAVGLFLSGVGRDAVRNSIRTNLRKQLGAAARRPEVLLRAGYGLSVQHGQFALPIEAWPPEVSGGRLGRKSVEGDLTEQDSCLAGGPGATSCEVTCTTFSSCSVSCQSGYYACCDCDWGVPDCDCVEDSVGGGECPPECEPYDQTP